LMNAVVARLQNINPLLRQQFRAAGEKMTQVVGQLRR